VYRKTDPHPYVVASLLHAPSHISLETALSHHGLIPEEVYQTASVTAARGRAFDTPIGRFTFQHVPARDPRAGVRAVKLGFDTWAFVASPLRAIADIVYLRPQGPGLRGRAAEGVDHVIADVLSSRIREYAPANAPEQENVLQELMQY
jgi:hypothetical protein